MHIEFVVEPEFNQKRLDVFLTEKTGFLRTKIQKLVEQNKVKINNKITNKNSQKLKINDLISFENVLDEKKLLKAEIKSLDIIFEDSDILAINKPAGMVSHPGNNNSENTLLNYLYGYLKKEAFLVHRLDKDTSGIILIAKNEESLFLLQKQWQDRTVKKMYYALAKGHLDSKTGLIDAPILRSRKDKTEMDVSILEKAKEAKSYFEVLEKFTDTSLLQVRILTGRTHQIRVHFSAIKHPIVGDRTYGNIEINKIFSDQYGLKRQFLHAYTLEFLHPKSGKKNTLTTDLPADLDYILEELRKDKKN